MAITLITGGARSGKSSFAEQLAKEYARQCRKGAEESEGSGVLYIATAIPYDAEMVERICRHQRQRPANWRTVEGYQNLAQIVRAAGEPVILLDCLTVMATNLLFAVEINADEPDPLQVAEVEKRAALELEELIKTVREARDRELIIVTNELGMGLVPPYPLGRIFRDLAGRLNQLAAAQSDRVDLMVSGIPVRIKGGDQR